MFTLSSARSAIGNPAYFARGGADVQEGRVSGVTVREEDGLLAYQGVVRGAEREYRASFLYDEDMDVFASFACTCGADRGCRHVAVLMIAACGGAATSVGARDGREMIGALLERSRMNPARRSASAQESVHLYPALRRVSGRVIALGLKIGRTRPYVVRSMAELAARTARREAAPDGQAQLVQGVIDCCFEEDGQWVLVDYKTDSPRDVQAVLDKHRPQLNVYADALLRITGMEVRERVLYLVRAGAGYVV